MDDCKEYKFQHIFLSRTFLLGAQCWHVLTVGRYKWWGRSGSPWLRLSEEKEQRWSYLFWWDLHFGHGFSMKYMRTSVTCLYLHSLQVSVLFLLLSCSKLVMCRTEFKEGRPFTMPLKFSVTGFCSWAPRMNQAGLWGHAYSLSACIEARVRLQGLLGCNRLVVPIKAILDEPLPMRC